jgi:hypothetical protein
MPHKHCLRSSIEPLRTSRLFGVRYHSRSMLLNRLKSPLVGAILAFALIVSVARLVSFFWPRFHLDLYPGVRTHHYVYGIFLLAIAGYLALLFKDARATPWIAIVYGAGLGLTFDEFGFWITLNGGRGVRWNSNGLLLVALIFAAATAGPRFYKKFRRVTLSVSSARAVSVLPADSKRY